MADQNPPPSSELPPRSKHVDAQQQAAEKEQNGEEGEGETEADKSKAQQKILNEITTRLAEVQALQSSATELRQKAEKCKDDSDEKQELLFEAVKKEKKATSELKIVKRLQSGVWQGAAGGAGIGAGFGMGLGMGVGTILGGVVSVPTTIVGGLAGLATGAIHGPWVKIPGFSGKDENGEEVRTEEMVVKTDGS